MRELIPPIDYDLLRDPDERAGPAAGEADIPRWLRPSVRAGPLRRGARPGAATGATRRRAHRIGEPFAASDPRRPGEGSSCRNPHQERGMKRPLIALALVGLLAACGDQGGGQKAGRSAHRATSAAGIRTALDRPGLAPRRSHPSPTSTSSSLSDLGDHKAEVAPTIQTLRVGGRLDCRRPAGHRRRDQSQHRRTAAQYRLRGPVAGRLADLQGARIVLISRRRP